MKVTGYIKSFFAVLTLAAITCLYSSCRKEPMVEPDDTPAEEVPGTIPVPSISNVENPYEDKLVSYYGETISIKFDASDSWMASLELVTDPDDKWAKITATSASGAGKSGSTVRIAVDENECGYERVLKLWVTVLGNEKECVCTLTQAPAGVSKEAIMNKALNTYMHDILTKDYLFADAYNAQEIDLTVPYDKFLDRHLALGKSNIEDGGYYRNNHENAGKRYIYTSFVEVTPPTRAVSTYGLGFGPFISTALSENSQEMGLAPSYVRRGSPAEAAGLRRGDIIYEVNGVRLTTANYLLYMSLLYQEPSGSYKFSYLRFESDGNGGYNLTPYTSSTVAAASYMYNPVLHASVLDEPKVRIGYLVYEAFDLSSQNLLKEAVMQFSEAGIEELILDLRFNSGGSVAQSRWLSGCIAGASHGSDTFAKMVYNDRREENWTFDYGYDNDTDNLGLPIDLNLKRLFVITSYNTASAAELVISSLRGIDFPVKMIGSRTEGKNVGMTVSETVYKGRRFQFSPVTFRLFNAKGWGDYQDGIAPDEYVNNDNNVTADDVDNVFPYSFSDWTNMDYNIALQWAYCDITGKPRWKTTPGSRQASARSLASEIPAPVDFQPLESAAGRYGNLVYEN